MPETLPTWAPLPCAVSVTLPPMMFGISLVVWPGSSPVGNGSCGYRKAISAADSGNCTELVVRLAPGLPAVNWFGKNVCSFVMNDAASSALFGLSASYQASRIEPERVSSQTSPTVDTTEPVAAVQDFGVASLRSPVVSAAQIAFWARAAKPPVLRMFESIGSGAELEPSAPRVALISTRLPLISDSLAQLVPLHLTATPSGEFRKTLPPVVVTWLT